MPVTYAASTELDAVNQILSSVGQAPVTTLDLQNPEVAIVLTTLREVNKQVQSEGWMFNQERNYTLKPDSTTEEILYPTNALQVDTNEDQHRDDYDVVRRGKKLYDRLNHTYKFKQDIKADITWLYEFDDVPPPIQNYITARAARMSAIKTVGEAQLSQLLQEQELMTRATAVEYDCNQGEYSIFGWRDGENTYNNYQPYNALAR
ncbi:tail tubular protein A [Synechococcus phage S-SBP1]|uniref:Tail tubular protein A n=1 Tax=Synechococcus phage S-SBP1 TaxID=2735125 RepID=A0A6M4EQA6_9CAUD|nr:tail tubular protein A [Synechococcus phage S-SBP1]